MASLPPTTRVWAAQEAKGQLVSLEIPLPALGSFDTAIKVIHCGICHSDLHLIDNDWRISEYPLVPGHEIIGRVEALGPEVRHLKRGDVVGVGWQSGSCLECHYCHTGRENLCESSGATCVGRVGGFADWHVTDSRFCFKIPDNLVTPGTAPLLCGGATVFSPLCEFVGNRSPWRTHVGVIGMGGLGHMALKMAQRMGYEVTAFTNSPHKASDLKVLGAHHVVSSNSEADIVKAGRRLDLIISTAPYDLPWNAYLRTLRPDGTLCFVGVPPSPLSIHAMNLLGGRLRVAGSPIAGRARMEEMLEFCSRHGITAQSEVFEAARVNDAIAAVRSGKVRYRAVLSFS